MNHTAEMEEKLPMPSSSILYSNNEVKTCEDSPINVLQELNEPIGIEEMKKKIAEMKEVFEKNQKIINGHTETIEQLQPKHEAQIIQLKAAHKVEMGKIVEENQAFIPTIIALSNEMDQIQATVKEELRSHEKEVTKLQADIRNAEERAAEDSLSNENEEIQNQMPQLQNNDSIPIALDPSEVDDMEETAEIIKYEIFDDFDSINFGRLEKNPRYVQDVTIIAENTLPSIPTLICSTIKYGLEESFHRQTQFKNHCTVYDNGAKLTYIRGEIEPGLLDSGEEEISEYTLKYFRPYAIRGDFVTQFIPKNLGDISTHYYFRQQRLSVFAEDPLYK